MCGINKNDIQYKKKEIKNMKVNEVRKTETIEKLVKIEYIAEDGTIFYNEEECKKYEESALFAEASS